MLSRLNLKFFFLHFEIVRDSFSEIAEFRILHLVHAEESISSEMLVLITVLLALGTILLIIRF